MREGMPGNDGLTPRSTFNLMGGVSVSLSLAWTMILRRDFGWDQYGWCAVFTFFGIPLFAAMMQSEAVLMFSYVWIAAYIGQRIWSFFHRFDIHPQSLGYSWFGMLFTKSPDKAVAIEFLFVVGLGLIVPDLGFSWLCFASAAGMAFRGLLEYERRARIRMAIVAARKELEELEEWS